MAPNARRGMAWLCALLVGACSDAASPEIALVRVVPEADDTCGRPDDGRTLVLTALGDFPAADVVRVSRPIDDTGPFAVDSFPLATRVLHVEVLGDGGAVRAVGKTAPIAFETLSDGERVPVFMAPPVGVCPTGPPGFARFRALLARAGGHVLIAGGSDENDAPVLALERYDPGTGGFEDMGLSHYGTGAHGLIGASLTSVIMGEASAEGPESVAEVEPEPTHILLAGGAAPAYQVYSAETGALSSRFFLEPGRAHHAAVALGQGQVFLAGGCSPLTDDHQCQPSSALMNTSIVDVGLGEVRPGPALMRPRILGHALREAQDSVLLVGGIDDLGSPVVDIERVHPSGAPGELIPGMAGAAVTLASGSVLLGTGYPGGARDPSLFVLPARGRVARPAMSAPWPLGEATMTALESGAVLLSGDTGSGPDGSGLYLPERGALMALDASRSSDMPGPGHAAVALGDGSVLMVGGRPAEVPAGSARARAWVVRPGLVGHYASDIFISFSDAALARGLIPRDPSLHTLMPASQPDVPAHLVMRAGPGGGALPVEWAVIAGPILTRGRIETRIRSLGGGVALMLGFRAADEYMAIILAAGQPVTVYRVRADAAVRLSGCQGRVMDAEELAPPGPGPGDERSVPLVLFFERDAVRMEFAEQEVLACQGLDEPVPAGRVGVGVVGAEDAGLRVDLITVAR